MKNSLPLLKTRYLQKGYSLSILASMCNITRATLYGLEKGKWLPSLTTASKLAAVLECTTDDIASDFGIHPTQVQINEVT